MTTVSGHLVDARGRRAKRSLMLVLVVASGLAFLAWSQNWFDLTLRSDNGQAILAVPGATASPALAALGLAGLALVAALAIAGRVVRFVLGVLGVALGASIIAASAGALADPATASLAAVGSSTGVAGIESVRALVLSAAVTLWPVVAIIAGALTALCSVGVLVTGAWWPRSSRRYQPVVFESAAGDRSADPADLITATETSGDAEPSRAADSTTTTADRAAADRAAAAASGRPGDAAVEDWDRLSAGQDPTT